MGCNRLAGLPLLHHDAQMLVLVKPAGLLAVPGRGPDKQDCLSARVQAADAQALVVHRLDQATSGLMLMARTPHAQRALSHAFAQRQVDKRYLAWVHGRVPMDGAWQTIDLPILADWPRRPLRIIDAQGQPSQTRWRGLRHHPVREASLVELEPLTGRTHQLRVHLQALGHAIWGDTLYAPPQVRDGSARLLLHAWRLGLTHPQTGARLQWQSDPDDWTVFEQGTP